MTRVGSSSASLQGDGSGWGPARCLNSAEELFPNAFQPVNKIKAVLLLLISSQGWAHFLFCFSFLLFFIPSAGAAQHHPSPLWMTNSPTCPPVPTYPAARRSPLAALRSNRWKSAIGIYLFISIAVQANPRRLTGQEVSVLVGGMMVDDVN